MNLNNHVVFLIGCAFLKLCIEDLQMNGVDLVCKCSKDLNTTDVCQEVAILIKLVTKIDETSIAFGLLQLLCKQVVILVLLVINEICKFQPNFQ